MKHSSIRNERGSITVLTIGAVVIGVTFLLVVANVGNIWLKRDAAQDAAEMLAPLLLANQLSYKKIPGAPNTQVLANTLATEANLKQGFGTSFSITYQFGTANGTTFTRIDITNPDPSKNGQYFNAVAVQVETTPVNLGSLFGMTFGAVQGQAIAAVDSLPPSDLADCCKEKCIPLPWMAEMACKIGCAMLEMMVLMFSMFTLDGDAFLSALACLLDTMFMLPATAWNDEVFSTVAKVIIDISV